MLAWLRLATSSSARFGAASPTQLCERFRTHQAANGPAGNQTQEAGVEKPHAAGDRGRHRNAGDRAVPATLKKDGRSHPPHLRTWRDGWRHLRFFLIFSPRCLFFYPGLALLILGIAISILLLPGPVYITPSISLDIHTFLVSAVTILIGMQCISFAVVVRRYAAARGLLPRSKVVERFLLPLTLERVLLGAMVIGLLGLGGMIWWVARWADAGFGPLQYGAIIEY